MKILAVDTSTASGSIALLDGPRLMAEWTLHSAQTHNRRLLKTVDLFLKEVNWKLDEIDGFAVTTGPGSFTGLRIGLTTVKTMAWTLNKPFVGIPTLDALAQSLAFASLPICAILDARKKEVYCAFYQPDGRGSVTRVGPYLVLPPEKVIPLVQSTTLFCGDGWLMYGAMLKEKLGDLALEASPSCHIIRAAAIGELALRKFQENLQDDPMTCAPLYVRPSEAEINYPHVRPLKQDIGKEDIQQK